ncbi:MAG TPA: putative quinol monooxygenase [Burkholderiales bacterium]|nr:putative quinol monooxygenase [Burkholderiales bacterium]
MRFVVIVEFTLHENTLEKFMPLMLENARISLEQEAGCDRFDVLNRAGRPNEIVLYEIYRDRAAFDAHLKSRHFLQFNAASAPYTRDKRIVELDYLNDAGN